MTEEERGKMMSNNWAMQMYANGYGPDGLALPLKEHDMSRLAKATAEAEDWLKKAPYLCYDLAKELIEAAKEVTQDGNQ